MHNTCNTDLADYTTHRTAQAPDPHHSTLNRVLGTKMAAEKLGLL